MLHAQVMLALLAAVNRQRGTVIHHLTACILQAQFGKWLVPVLYSF